MRNMFQGGRFLKIVVVPSALWLLLCVIYISVPIGWESLFFLLPHEIGVFLLSIFLPILIFICIFALTSGGDENQEQVLVSLRRLGDQVETLSRELIRLTDEREKDSREIDGLAETLRDTRQVLVAELEGLKLPFADALGVFGNQNHLLRDLGEKLEILRQSQHEIALRSNSSEIGQLAARLGVINVVLNDISVSATRLVVFLMEQEKRGKEEIREFVRGLVSAYSAGDRDVFFRVLHERLANAPQRIEALQRLSMASSGVSRDVTKIMREMDEILLLIKELDDDDIIRTVYDDTAIRAFYDVMEAYFNPDGSAKVPMPAAEHGLASNE